MFLLFLTREYEFMILLYLPTRLNKNNVNHFKKNKVISIFFQTYFKIYVLQSLVIS